MVPSDSLPRKVLIGTVMHYFQGDSTTRLNTAAGLIDEVALEAARKHPGKGLDLVVLPEHAIQEGQNASAKSRAVTLEGDVLNTMGQKARQYHTYLIVPVILLEKKQHDGVEVTFFSNTCVLLDREGMVAGIYRKVHPVGLPDGQLEGGITPGRDFPVFECDFGKLGIQICWDVSYEDGWMELARKGAEIVVFSTASPQTVRTASLALRGHYHVVTSTPRNNVSIFNPLGMTTAQITSGSVLVHQVDLSYARMFWQASLDNGKALTERFGDKVGYLYSEREDAGVFWSNDSETTIGSMIRHLNLWEQDYQTEKDLRKRDASLG